MTSSATCPHCGNNVILVALEPVPPIDTGRKEATCWRSPNPHPPHPWQDEETKQQLWCPGVKGTTMY